MKKLLLVLLMVPLFCGTCYAEDLGEEAARMTEVFQVENGLDEDELAVSGELRVDGSYDARGAIARLWDRFVTDVRDQLREELRFALRMVLIAFLCSIASVFSPNQKLTEYMEIAACCTAALLLAGSMDGIITQAEGTLNRLSDYGKAAFPAFFTTVAACGAAVSASVKYAAVCFAMELFMSLSQRLILPLIYAYLAVSISGSIFENAMLKTAVRFTKWCAVTAMTALTTVFCVYISLSGVITGSADAAAVKTTKTVISSALPVVGGILSDSASAMLAAAGLIKNSAGVFCLVVVCVLCAGSFAVLSVKMLVFKAASAISELACGGRFSQLLGNIGTAFGMLLGLVGSYGMMLFLSIMSGIKMVNL